MRILTTSIATFLIWALFSPAKTQEPPVCDQPTDMPSVIVEMSKALNEFREDEKKRPVDSSDKLSRIASEYACLLARTGHFDHVGPDDSTLSERTTRGHYKFCTIAENLARGQRSVQEVFASWVASPGHNRNMVLRGVSEFGLGVAFVSSERPAIHAGSSPSSLSELAASLRRTPKTRTPSRSTPLVWVLLLGDEC